MSEEKPRLEAASNGYQVHYRGRRLYAAHDPRGGAVRRATAAEIQPQTLVIVASPLLGYGLSELLDICPPDAVVLAVELDPVLTTLPPETAPTDDRLIWARAPSAADLDRILERALSRRPRRTRLVGLSGGFGLQAGEYRSLAGRLDDEIRIFWQNAMTRMRMGRLWIRNLFRNLPLMAASTPLDSLKSSLPIVVVGAGPSLDDCAAELPRDGSAERERVHILAVDTAVAPLAAREITPDFILAVESQQANAGDFLTPPDAPGEVAEHGEVAEDGTGPTTRRPHLICDITAYPGVLHRAGTGGLTFVSSRFAPTALLERLSASGILPPEVPPLGSVGVLGVHLAARLTTDAVYFSGLDFSYDLERTHARGAPMQTLSLARRTRLDPSPFFGMAVTRPLLMLEGKDGRPTRSDTVLLSYAEQLRSTISRLPEGSVYDLSPDLGLPNGAPAAPGPLTAAGTRGGTRARPGETTDAGAGAGAGPADGATAVDAGLSREEARLSELVSKLRDIIGRAGTDEDVSAHDYAEARPMLLDLDYVYLDFPDPPAPSRNFLGRVLLSALDYEGRVRRVRLMTERLPGGRRPPGPPPS